MEIKKSSWSAQPQTNQRGFGGAKASSKRGKCVGVLFGFAFFAAGALFCWMGAVKPIIGVIESGSWPTVPCVIEASQVKTHRGSDSTTYSVDIRFSYSFGGVDYSGGSYNFSDFSSSGYDSKKAIVDRYPVGFAAVCWVNPADPRIAVLSRDVPTIVFFLIPFSSIFMLIGGGVMLGSVGLIPAKWIPGKQRVSEAGPVVCEGAYTLKPATSGLGKVIAALAFTVFWNGIVSVFVWQIFVAFEKGRPDWVLTVFMIPFVLVGIVLILYLIQCICALWNPRYTLVLGTSAPRLGQQTTLQWTSTGSIHRLKNLIVTLEGTESATYRRGTRSQTDTCVFHRQILFETDTPAAHPFGDVNLLIPEDTMHSFEGKHNKLEWRITVSGKIDWWPDVNEDFPLTIHPFHPQAF